MFRIQWFCRTLIRSLRHHFMPPMIATRRQIDRASRAFVDDHMLNRRTGLQRLFHHRKKFHLGSAPVRPILRNHRNGLGIVNAIHQGVRRKSAKHNRMRSSYPRASQHGNRQLRSHSHINRHPIAFADSQCLQNVRELLHFSPKLLVGVSANFARLAFPDQRGFILARRLYMPVQTVVRKIDLPAHKPFRPRCIPLQNLVPLFEPVQVLCHAPPEFLRLLHRLLIKRVIFGKTLNLRQLGKLRRRRKTPLLVKNRIDIYLRGRQITHG